MPFEDLGLIRDELVDRGFEIDYLDAGIDPVDPERLIEPDLVVILGGPIGVNDVEAYPFLRSEQDAIAARLERDRPTLGVCLGAQLMAAALGAEVTATGRTEIGFSPLTLTPAGERSVLAPLAGRSVLHWHGDEFAIPAHADRLAETPGFPHQAFGLGPRVLGLQFHIEADHTQIERWLVGHAHELASAGVDPRVVRAAAAVHGPALRAVAGEVVGAWIDALEEPLG